MFQNLILTFRLTVDLKMKRCVQFTFDFDKITNSESIFTNKQKFSIKNNIFNSRIRQ